MSPDALLNEAQRLDDLARWTGGYQAEVLAQVAASFRNLAADQAGPQGIALGVDIEEAVERRKCALSLSIQARMPPEHADDTVTRAAAFDRFLDGTDAHPANPAPPETMLQLRTRDNAIEVVRRAVNLYTNGLDDAFAEHVVDDLLRTEDA